MPDLLLPMFDLWPQIRLFGYRSFNWHIHNTRTRKQYKLINNSNNNMWSWIVMQKSICCKKIKCILIMPAFSIGVQKPLERVIIVCVNSNDTSEDMVSILLQTDDNMQTALKILNNMFIYSIYKNKSITEMFDGQFIILLECIMNNNTIRHRAQFWPSFPNHMLLFLLSRIVLV